MDDTSFGNVKTFINGKEINLRLDLGVVRTFKRETGKNLLETKEDDWKDIDMLAMLMLFCARRGGHKDITEDEIDCMTLPELTRCMTELVEGFMPEGAKGKEAQGNVAPLTQKRRK
ncbi:MAG: hypothetical protein WCY59_01910 [Anaerovoracaceae bacterium]